MQNAFQLSSTFYRSVLLLGCVLMGPLLVGCSEQAPQLTAKVTTPVGRPGVCAICDKKVESVTEAHLVTIEGIQYVVCDGKCGTDLQEWISKQ